MTCRNWTIVTKFFKLFVGVHTWRVNCKTSLIWLWPYVGMSGGQSSDGCFFTMKLRHGSLHASWSHGIWTYSVCNANNVDHRPTLPWLWSCQSLSQMPTCPGSSPAFVVQFATLKNWEQLIQCSALDIGTRTLTSTLTPMRHTGAAVGMLTTFGARNTSLCFKATKYDTIWQYYFMASCLSCENVWWYGMRRKGCRLTGDCSSVVRAQAKSPWGWFLVTFGFSLSSHSPQNMKHALWQDDSDLIFST